MNDEIPEPTVPDASFSYGPDGPWVHDGLGRDWCHAWTQEGRRCGMRGTAWPWGLLSSDVYLCGIHGRRMEAGVESAIRNGLLKVRSEAPPKRAPIDSKPHTVYRYYDAEGAPLYIGMTSNFHSRDRAHSEKAWYAQVARLETVEYPDKVSADLAEREAIIRENPRFNIRHRPVFERERAS